MKLTSLFRPALEKVVHALSQATDLRTYLSVLMRMMIGALR